MHVHGVSIIMSSVIISTLYLVDIIFIKNQYTKLIRRKIYFNYIKLQNTTQKNET